MDREEALKLLGGGTEGIADWNRRRESGEDPPDLTAANLSQANLSGADLSGADLSRADLSRADLSGASLRGASLCGSDLRSANLSGTDLSRATLSEADLSGAKLSAADLSGADLNGANLRSADLSEASLSGADLHGAICWDTTFVKVDLYEVKGLDSIKHSGPSTIAIDTLIRSQGKIPDVFLLGCGVPDAFINCLASLLRAMQPIQTYSCFISHSSKDQAFADRLHSRMVQEKLSVWYAPEDMRGGRKSVEQIDQAIRVHDKLLLVLSKASMASDWVKYEIMRAVAREKQEKPQVLFPIGLASRKTILAWSAFDTDSGKDIAKVVREYHIPDFSNWKDDDSFEEAFTGLLEDLKAEDSAGLDAPAPRAGRPKKPR